MITKETLTHLASLSKLELCDSQTDMFLEQMSSIIELMDTIKDVDVSDIPSSLPEDLDVSQFREDEISPSLSLEQVLSNAPKSDRGLISVPKVME